MGQAFGVPVVNGPMAPFCNLPKEALQSLWTSYNLLGEGWGLAWAEFKAIFKGAHYVMGMGFSDDQLMDLFNALDTDANGLVDALEMLITLALASGMDTVDKIYFVFAVYDFNNSSILSGDECTLMLRSTTKGLAKLYPSQAPRFLANTDGDIFADLIFKSVSATGSITNQQFMQYCIAHPVISSWMVFNSSIPVLTAASVQRVDAADLKVTDLSSYVPEVKFAAKPLAEAECLPYVVSAALTLELESEQQPSEEAKGGDEAAAAAAAAAAATAAEAAATAAAAAAAAATAAGGDDEEGSGDGIVVATAPIAKLDPRIPWGYTVESMTPAEVPPTRNDNPEDSFELLWVHGNAASSGLRNMAMYTSGGQIVYCASRHAVTLTKGGAEGEPPTWSQRLMSEHQYPLTCMTLDPAGAMLATGDRINPSCAPLNGRAADPSRIVLSSIATGGVISYMSAGSAVGAGVRLLSFSANSKLLLAVYADSRNTVCIYEVATGESIFLGELSETPLDVSFCGTDAIFATASEDGVSFYVDEGNKFLPSAAFRKYERRQGLLQTVGKAAAGVAATAVCRYEHPDETISANVAGQIIFWHGRNCIQLLSTHRGAVTCLSYSPTSKLLSSAGKDGTVCLYKLTAMPTLGSVAARKGPRLVQVRQLEMTGSFDMMLIFVPSRKVVSLSLHKSGEKVLVGTSSGDLLELSLVPTLPEGAAGGEEAAPPAEGAEGEAAPPSEAPIKMPRLGTDLNGGPIVSCHWSGAAAILPKPMVWGLCKAPGGFVSVGSDGLICQWSAAEGAPQKLVKRAECDSGLRGVSVSASALAVSFDGTVLPSRAGTIQIFSFPEMAFQAEFKVGRQIMNIVRFSPDGSALLCAGADPNIYFYSLIVPEGAEAGTAPVWTQKGMIETTVGTLAVDFTSDGACIRVVDAMDKLAVFDSALNIGAQIKNAEILRSLTWAGSTCPCNWDTKGVFKGVEPLRVGEECEKLGPGMVEALGAVDRSQHLFINAGPSGVMTITRVPADADIHLDYPVGKNSLPIHCGRVSAVCFIEEGSRLVTAGADDGVIQVWKVQYDTEEPEPDALPGTEGEEPPPTEEEIAEANAPKEAKGYDSAEDEDLFDGPSFMTRHLSMRAPVLSETDAVDSWLTSVDLNADQLDIMSRKNKDRLITDELQLDWVYGYSARPTRGAVRYCHGGEIVYPAGCLGVVLDKAVAVGGTPTQSHFMGHCDEITCLDVHVPTGLVASGHKGTGNVIACVWNSANCETLKRINCGPVLGLSAIAFSPSGKWLAVACQDENHTVMIYEWKTGQLQASYSGGNKKVLGLVFSLDRSKGPDALRLLQYGVGHFKIVEIRSGRIVVKKAGLYGAGNKKVDILCGAALPLPAEGGSEFVVGMAGGSVASIGRGERKLGAAVAVWGKKSSVVSAMTVVVLKEATGDSPPVYRVAVGGKKLEICLLDNELTITSQFMLTNPEFGLALNSQARGIKSLCVDRACRKLLYGTSAGEIGEIDFEKGTDINSGPLVQGHYKDQLHAMATHPIRQELATAGDDKILRVWNMETKALMGQILLPDIIRAVCWAPNGHLILCGLGGKVPAVPNANPPRPDPRDFDGKVVVVSFLQNQLQVVHIAGDPFESITSIAYAPDGSRVYVGSMDTNIYVYDALDNFKLYLTLKAHGEGVAAVDASEDGKTLVSTSIYGEVMIWDTMSLEEKAAPIMPELGRLAQCKWVSRQGTRNWNSTGIFNKFQAAREVLSVSQSKDDKLLVTGDIFGAVRLFRNPSVLPGSNHKRYSAHSPGGVSRVGFSVSDKYLVTTGLNDRCVVQWKVVKSSAEPEINTKEWEPKAAVAKVAGSTSLPSFSESFIVGDTNMAPVREIPEEGESAKSSPDDASVSTAGGSAKSSASTAPAAAAAAAAAVPIDVMTAPVSCSYVGVGCVSSTAEYEETFVLAAPQLKRPFAAYGGLGTVLTLCGKRLVSNADDRLKQATWSFPGDSGEVGAIVLTPCARLLAVGTCPSYHFPAGSPERLAFKGVLSVLSAATGNVVSVLSETIMGGVQAADFSHDSKMLACIGGDNLHMLHLFFSCSAVWDDPILLYTGECSVLTPTCISFLSGGAAQFATGGACPLKFWSVCGRNVSFQCVEEPISESRIALDKKLPAALTCTLGIPGTGQLVVGDEDGFVGVFVDSSATTAQRLPLTQHVSAVSALSVFWRAGKPLGFISAANDGVKIWSLQAAGDGSSAWASELYSFPTADLYAPLANAAPITKALKMQGGETVYASSISPDAVGQRLLVGLSVNAVVEISTDSGSVLVVTEGQLPRVRVTGIVAHPSEPYTLVTAHSNNTVKVWDLSYSARECVSLISITHMPDGLCFLSDTLLAVGISKGDTGGISGGILFLDLSPPSPAPAAGTQVEGKVRRGLYRQLKVLNRFHNVGKGAVLALRMSSDGKYLAAGSEDGNVYLYPTDTSSTLQGTLTLSPGVPVHSLDFSANSRFLRAFGPTPKGDTVIKARYFDFEAGGGEGEVAAAVTEEAQVLALRDVKWSTCSSTAALEARCAHVAAAVGAIPGQPPVDAVDGMEQTTSVCADASGALIAAGYSDGTTRIFRSPAQCGAEHVINNGHSAGRVVCAFLASGQLASCCEQDGTIMVWTI